MSNQRFWTMVVMVLLFVGPVAGGQGSIDSSQASAFMGSWVFTMTEPESFKGSQQTVRIWDKNGVVAASVQIGKFPVDVTGILRDADMLVLTISNKAQPAMLENGAPIWVVISLTLDGDVIKMAQMLERSQTIKRGMGKKQ